MHANSYLAWRFASAVPVDLMVHGMWNWIARPADGDSIPAGIRAVLDWVSARPIPSCLPCGSSRASPPSTIRPSSRIPRLAKVLPASVLAWYRSGAGAGLRGRGGGGSAGRTGAGGILGGVEQAAMVTEDLGLARGGRLVFGSDTPSGPTYGKPPGLNGYLEVASAGGRPGAARSVAGGRDQIRNGPGLWTRKPYGTVEVGKVANLLPVGGGPAESVTAYEPSRGWWWYGGARSNGRRWPSWPPFRCPRRKVERQP